MQGSIQLEHVAFAYPAEPEVDVCRDVQLAIPGGSSVALVGASGSGKSTVIQLLSRFYDPTSGAVKVDGKDIRRFDLRWFRSQVRRTGVAHGRRIDCLLGFPVLVTAFVTTAH